jgi:transposase
MTQGQGRAERTIRLQARERRDLEALLRGPERRARVRVRARVLLLSHEDWDCASIATATGSSTSTVGRVRRRYCEEGLKAALSERPRPGASSKLSAQQEQRVVALACTGPPKGFARWSLRLLTSEAIHRGIVPKVSREPIRMVLHEHGIKPWREKNVVRSSSR